MNADPLAKIAMLKGSMRCFDFGLAGLLPVIGVPFALSALWIGGRVRRQERQYWNAAKPFRIWGIVCAGIGAVLWVTIDGLIVFNAIAAGWPYNN